MKKLKAAGRRTPITIFVEGDIFTKLSFAVWGLAIAVWITSIYSGAECRQRKLADKKVPGILDDITSLFDTHIVRLFLSVPLIGILVFTVTPLIWAVVACFSCYFGGIFLAILINSKGIRFKKMWRAIFIFAMAIPAFVSLLVINTMLGQYGIINVLLQNWGFTTETLPFLTNATWARGTVIVVNLWLGIPSTMLMVSGILMNIPPDLYESASIDGAPHFTIFYKLMIPMAKPIIIYQLMTASAVLR